MGKGSSAPATPVWSPSQVWDGDRLVSETKKNTDGTIANYTYPSAEEKATQANQQQGINTYMQAIKDYEPQVNTLSPEFNQSVDNATKAYTDNQMQQFNQTYDPQLRTLREDSAKRFGTTQNSWYQDQLERLARVQGDTVKNITNEATTQATNLRQQELANKLQYLNQLRSSLSSLQGGNSQYQQGQLSNYNASTNLSNMGNSFNNNVYNAEMQKYLADQQKSAQAGSAVSSALGAVGSTALMFSDVTLKKNLTPVYRKNGLTVYDFDYIDRPYLPTGRHRGVIAQEVEQYIPSAVVDTPYGKMVDYAQVLPLIA